ncbi:MAG: alkaline phosphatase family protein, partial [Candidatus Hydrogenedentota bacterium]
LQFHPVDQYIRFTTPESYGAELKDRYGFFKTIGWEFDTHALRQDALTNEVFLQDVRDTMAWTERLALNEMDRGQFDLLVAASTGPDRVSHMFWAYRDSKHPLYTPELAAKYGRVVEDSYTIMDGIVGNVMAKLAPNDLLMIMSDHGFHSFRRGFNVNTWLIREGYLSVEGQTDVATATNPKSFLDGYDWPTSKAYNLGLGSIFLNLRGREGKGIVDPKAADAVIAEIREKLLAVTDPKTGEKVFSQIYTRADYKGIASADAPDIQLGYAEGYQSTKDAVKGTAPSELFEDNDDKWSGEHAASDPVITPGIFFSNKPITAEKPDLVDIGVTTLNYLGRAIPSDFEGKNLF